MDEPRSKPSDQMSREELNLVSYIRNRYILGQAAANRIPSEADLLEEARSDLSLSMSRAGVRKVLAYLRGTNELKSEERKGHIVADPRQYTLKLRSSLTPLHEKFRFSDIEVSQLDEKVDRWIVNLLHAPFDAVPHVFESVRRVTSENGDQALVVSKHYIYSDKLDYTVLEEDVHSLQSMSRALAKHGIKWIRKSTGVNARMPTSREVELMKIGQQDPILETIGVNVDINRDRHLPVEVTVSAFPSHKWDIVFYFDEPA